MWITIIVAHTRKISLKLILECLALNLCMHITLLDTICMLDMALTIHNLDHDHNPRSTRGYTSVGTIDLLV